MGNLCPSWALTWDEGRELPPRENPNWKQDVIHLLLHASVSYGDTARLFNQTSGFFARPDLATLVCQDRQPFYPKGPDGLKAWASDTLQFTRDPLYDGFAEKWSDIVQKFPPESLAFDLSPLLRACIPPTSLSRRTRFFLSSTNQGVAYAAFARLQFLLWQEWMKAEEWITDDWRVICWYEGEAFYSSNLRTETFIPSRSSKPSLLIHWSLTARIDGDGECTCTLDLHSITLRAGTPERVVEVIHAVQKSWPTAEIHTEN